MKPLCVSLRQKIKQRNLNTITTKQKAADVALVTLTLSFLILLGGGFYEAINITPKIASAPPQSLEMLQGPYGFHPIRFWIIFHPLTEILFIICLILHWKNSPFRKTMLLLSFSFLIIIRLATLFYFAPEVGAITNVPFSYTIDTSLVSRAKLWEILNVGRLLIYVGTGVLLLLALRKNFSNI